MAKSKSGKVIQMLSPENYIRKKARTLPVFECMVSSDWKETKLLHVVVARSHTNGNITACFYLVDLLLMGVKDTDYMFNRLLRAPCHMPCALSPVPRALPCQPKHMRRLVQHNRNQNLYL